MRPPLPARTKRGAGLSYCSRARDGRIRQTTRRDIRRMAESAAPVKGLCALRPTHDSPPPRIADNTVR
jgi:hypothetical protein